MFYLFAMMHAGKLGEMGKVAKVDFFLKERGELKIAFAPTEQCHLVLFIVPVDRYCVISYQKPYNIQLCKAFQSLLLFNE